MNNQYNCLAVTSLMLVSETTSMRSGEEDYLLKLLKYIMRINLNIKRSWWAAALIIAGAINISDAIELISIINTVNS